MNGLGGEVSLAVGHRSTMEKGNQGLRFMRLQAELRSECEEGNRNKYGMKIVHWAGQGNLQDTRMHKEWI